MPGVFMKRDSSILNGVWIARDSLRVRTGIFRKTTVVGRRNAQPNPQMPAAPQLLPDAIQISTSGLKIWEYRATNQRVKSPGIVRLPRLPERCMVSVICAGFKKMWRTFGFGNPLPGTARSQRITPDFGFCRAALLQFDWLSDSWLSIWFRLIWKTSYSRFRASRQLMSVKSGLFPCDASMRLLHSWPLSFS